jgi:hypothetical protein
MGKVEWVYEGKIWVSHILGTTANGYHIPIPPFTPLRPIRNRYAHIPQRGEGRRLKVMTIKYINKRMTYKQYLRSSGVEKYEGRGKDVGGR